MRHKRSVVPHKKYKYKIYFYLSKLPFREYRIARNKLPIALKVSKSSFERWIYLRKTDTSEIPADKLAIIAEYFDLPMREFFNYPIPKFSVKSLEDLETDLDKLGRRFGMTR